MRLSCSSRLVALGSLSALSLGLAGCDATVALGGECQPFGVVCNDLSGGSDGDSDRDGGASFADGDAGLAGPSDATVPGGEARDAAAPDGAADDAQVPGDAGELPDPSDAGLSLFPAIGNPSFELQNGSPPGEYGTLGGADISPWYHCQTPVPGFYRVEESTSAMPARDGDNYFAFGFPVVYDLPLPLHQQLAEPMLAGQRYAFMIDVRAEANQLEDMIALNVRGGNAACAAVTPLGGTDYLPDGVWVERCIAFTAPTDLTQLAFVPAVRGPIAVTFRLLIDNIRSDPRCR